MVGSLPLNAAASVAGHPAVGVDDDLAPREAGVAHRPADDEATGRVDEMARAVVEQSVAGIAASTTCSRTAAARSVSSTSGSCWVLTRTGVDAPGLSVVVVLHRDLALAVGPQERQRPGLAPHLGQATGHAVREEDRHRHQLVRLVAGVSEHHPLVAGAELVLLDPLAGLERVVHPLRDVGRLLLDGGHRAAGLPVEPEAAIGVADLAHRPPDHVLDVDIMRGADLAEHEDQARRGRHLHARRGPSGRWRGSRRASRRQRRRRACRGALRLRTPR